MLNGEYSYVVNATGFCVAYAPTVSYVLQTGEALVSTPPMSNLYKPRWNGKAWGEGATLEELVVTKEKPQSALLKSDNMVEKVKILEEVVQELILMSLEV